MNTDLEILEKEVEGGFYFNKKEWDISVVSGKTGILKYKPSDEYVKISTLSVLALAPILGAMFVIYLPFIGFAMTIEELTRKGVGGFRTFVHSISENIIKER